MEEVVDDDPPATTGMREDALKQVEAAAFPRMFVRVLVHWAESLSEESARKATWVRVSALTTERRRKQRKQQM